MKIVLREEHAQRFCEPLIEFMRKNPELFDLGKRQDDLDNKVHLNVEEYTKNGKK